MPIILLFTIYTTSTLFSMYFQAIDPGWRLIPRPDSSDTVILFHPEGNSSHLTIGLSNDI